MLWLIASILCSASLALIFKRSERAGMNRSAITIVNYCTAASVCIVMWMGGDATLRDVDLGAGMRTVGRTVFGGGAEGALDDSGSVAWALCVGLIAGVIFPGALLLYQVSVKRHGASLAGAFIKLGVLVPMSLSLVIWREQPSAVQWGGIGLALVSIVLVNWPGRRKLRESIKVALLGLFLLGGLAEFSNKVFEHYAIDAYTSLFLMMVFGVSMLVCIPWWVRSTQRTTWRDIGFGVAVGVPNMYTSYFLIQSLETIPASVAFPAMAAGTILVINLASVVLFGERLKRAEWAAMGLILIALVLVNVKT